MKISRSGLKARQAKLRKLISDRGIKCLLVTNAFNVRYLTGFSSTYGVLVALPERTVFITDTRYATDARRRAVADAVEIIEPGASFGSVLKGILDARVKRIVFEAQDVTVARLKLMEKALKGMRFEASEDIVESMRIVKEPREVKLVRKASLIADGGFRHILPRIKPGVTEKDIAMELEAYLWKKGIDSLAFDTIVASGGRSAFPHAKPTGKRIRRGEFVVLDFGVCVEGYRCDMTRTVFVGTPDREQRRVYQAVRRAQATARAAAKVGVKLEAVDEAARKVLREENLEQEFTHGLGHGVGLQEHEAPRLARGQSDTLKKGMVFTIEPGVYIGRWGGVRIEDTCILGAKGTTPLSKSPRRMICVSPGK